MNSIGIRVAPKVVTFAVVDLDEKAIINIEEIRIPAAFLIPDSLKYIRSNILDVIREYSVESAGIRITESNAQSMSIERIQMEGVIQEAFASSDLKSYYIGQISNISKRLGFDRVRFKPMVSGDDDLGIENWGNMSKEAREAVLCGLGAENA